MDKLNINNIFIIVAITINFIIAFTDYFHGVLSHDTYYISEGTFHLIIAYGLCILFIKSIEKD